MSIRRIHVGLAGVANHGTTILNAIRASGNLQMVACFDVNAKASGLAAEQNGARAAASYEDLLADSRVEAIALATPNHLHAEQAAAAVAAGKHLFVEKPITTSIAEAREMIEAYRKAGLVLMVGHNTRRRQVFRRAHTLLQEGKIGTIVAIEGNLSRPAGLQPGMPAWKADPRACPLLPMTQLGIHLVDTVEYLVGPIARVSCAAASMAMHGGVYDTTAALLQLQNGVPFTLGSYYVTPDAYFLRLYGTQGILHCFPASMTVERMEEGRPPSVVDEQFPQEGLRSYELQMKEFGECVLHGTKPETDGETGLRALAVIEGMTESVRQGGAMIDVDALLDVHAPA